MIPTNRLLENSPLSPLKISNIFFYFKLFFNNYITNVDTLRKCVYYRKMLDEYYEKKIKSSQNL